MSTVVWNPQPRQRLVISCPFPEILYGGAAGGGKSDCLVGDWLAHQQQYGKYANGILFRNSYPELQEILIRMQDVYGSLGAKWKDKDATWTFPNGSRLRLSYLDSFEDALKHKGDAWSWRGHDELTQRPTDQEYRYLFSRMRSAHGIPVRTLCTTNPDGPGHLWVKKHWKIDQYPGGMVPVHSYTDLKTSRMLDEEEGKPYDKLSADQLPDGVRRNTRIFIPGRLADNKYLNDDGHYRAGLLALPEAQRQMLLDGRWDITEGAFFDEWDPKHHVIKAFKPPSDWKRWMAGDWGTNKPYCFGWFCESPQGDKYLYRELAGVKGGDYSKDQGTRESPLTVAERIRKIEQEADEFITERWLDASCFDNYEHGLSVAEQFSQRGVVFQKAQKKFKSGSIGMFRDHLKVVNGVCGFKIMDCCMYCITTIPLLLVDKTNVEQYDSDGPDHACLRYDTPLLTRSGWKQIQDINNEDVWTPLGWRNAVSQFTGIKQTVCVELSNGHKIHATNDHKFLTNRGFLDLTQIHTGDILIYGGYTDGSSCDFGENSGVSGKTILPLRILFPKEREEAPSDGVDVPQWWHTQGVSRSPQGRGPNEQYNLKSGIEEYFRAFEPAYDGEPEGMGQRKYKKSHSRSPRVASVGGWESLASEALSEGSHQGTSRNALEAGDMLPMLVHVQNQEGNTFLLGSLQDFWLESRVYGVEVKAVGPSGSVPVWDIGVADAHCALIGSGVFASNCDMILYGIRRNIRSREDIARERGVSIYNERLKRRFGRFGAH